jgi:hypothetical protein
MVVSQIIGGLGNQMFQYAAARALALKRGVPLFLDISAFASYELHQGFELKRIFGCSAEIATEYNLRKVLGWQHSLLARRVLIRPQLAMFRCKGFVVEPHFEYWAALNDVAPESYLVGYWQSEKYFQNVSQQIRKDFSFALPIENENLEIAKQIERTNSVSLHVRRGDYTNSKNTATYNICSLDYYNEAIKYITERTIDPYLYVFSDDINWVKTNLKIDLPCEFVDHNKGVNSFNDMRLMSFCDHNIIANSSFSWWGAWLNSNKNKIVVAPSLWFANGTNEKDLTPQSWVKI